jgi:hypothetical protein
MSEGRLIAVLVITLFCLNKKKFVIGLKIKMFCACQVLFNVKYIF